MNYLLVNNNIFLSNHSGFSKIDNLDDKKETLQNTVARICVVDVDIHISPAPEDFIELKEASLYKEFSSRHEGAYIIQDERLNSNLFQVIGIKEEKLREIYALVPSDKVEILIPYAVAIRSLLSENELLIENKKIVFIDDLKEEVLITVFDGQKFSKTRHLTHITDKNLVSEARLSLKSFQHKLGNSTEVAETPVLITNNKEWANALRAEEKELTVQYLDCQHPFLEGLKEGEFNIKFNLPEEIIKKKRLREAKKNLLQLAIAGSIAGVGIAFMAFTGIGLTLVKNSLNNESNINNKLTTKLEQIDKLIYRASLRDLKKINYSDKFLLINSYLTTAYMLDSMKLKREGKSWTMDIYLSNRDGEFLEDINKPRSLRSIEVFDYFINGKAGKYLKVDL